MVNPEPGKANAECDQKSKIAVILGLLIINIVIYEKFETKSWSYN